MRRSAVFLDRDGTIIEDAGYIGDPAKVRLFPDAAPAIRRLAAAGRAVVLISNQSGVARGMFTEDDVWKVHRRMEALFAEGGAQLDGAYYCPYLAGPEAKVAKYAQDSDLRKPKPGMLLQAAKELDIDLSRSWMIGDSVVDIEAGAAAGCRTILLGRDGVARRAAPLAKGGHGGLAPSIVTPTFRAGTLIEAAAIVEREMKTEPPSKTPSPVRGETPQGVVAKIAPGIRPPALHVAEEDAPADDRVVEALDRIHSQLERAQRRDRQHDFSSLRLLAALLQMLAIVTAVWGIVALMDDQAASTGRIALACFFQLGSLTAFLTDRMR